MSPREGMPFKGVKGFSSVVLVGLLTGLTLSVIAQDVSPATTPEPQTDPGTPLLEQSAAGKRCLACGQPIDASQRGVVMQYRGRRVFLHGADVAPCLEHWIADPDSHFRGVQARTALFDEGPGTRRPPPHLGWLYFGLYVLGGLIVGGITSYLAVAKGHPPIRWFFLGLIFNVLALVLLLTRGRGDLSAHPSGVPGGLRKVPLTHEPLRCKACGGENHPAAHTCIQCRAALTPSFSSEARTIRNQV